MFTESEVISQLAFYTAKCTYEKQCGTEREYLLKTHPLQSSDLDTVTSRHSYHKPTPTEDGRMVLWDFQKHKWRDLRPEGFRSIKTEFS